MLRFESKDWSERADSLARILEDEITGVVYTNALSAETGRIFINSIEQLKKNFFTDLNKSNGFSLPGMFGQLHKTQPYELVDSYFDDIDLFCKTSSDACGFDVVHWVSEKLASAFTPFQVNVLPGFLPYSFRIVYPGKGGLYMHRDGNLLPAIHQNVSDQIEKNIQAQSMMSWYFTLQASEKGGELWVADKLYDLYQKQGQFHIVSPEGVVIHEDEMEHLTIPTPSGSLLIFKGGSYWHRVVSPLAGSQERITLGGFMALATDSESVYFWS